MKILNQIYSDISKINNNDRSYAILVKNNVYEMLMLTPQFSCERNPFKDVPIISYYGVLVEIDNSIDNDFKILTKKEYDEWKERK